MHIREFCFVVQYQNMEDQKYTDIILEEMRSNFKIFGEVLEHVREKGDATFEQVVEIRREMNEMKLEIGNIKEDVAI